MRIELVIIIVTAFLIYNTYHDGKYTSMLYKNKKGMQIAFYAIAGVSLFVLLRKNPSRGKTLLLHANEAIRYMPIDKQSASILSPIIDFTVRDTNEHTFMGNLNPRRGPNGPTMTPEQRILQSGSTRSKTGGKATKRSVSETKKKYVASMQDWKCGDCREKLNAWFEVDHVQRLEYGGSNEVSNLVALCRNCHGKKTAFENM
uniref:HNH nuclease domain-containing protein n=1 Tax=viral metagenome TaxID=1070528 RepID=A0A6C0FDG7_9ZZZZ|tara:strand:+ start:7540 stop:8145 length:606 start_codon:yes stop_codon:yes gene_type:complete